MEGALFLKLFKSITGMLLAAVLVAAPLTANAQSVSDSGIQSNETFGAYAKNGITITGGAGVENGDVFVENGDVDLSSWSSLTPGATLYKHADAAVTGSAYQWSDLKNQVADYSEVPFAVNDYPFPEAPEDLPERDDLTVDWQYQNSYFELSESGSYDEINVKSNGKLAFQTEEGETLVISVNKLSVNGEITVLGKGNVHLFVDEFKTGNTVINPTGTKEQLSVVFTGQGKTAGKQQTLTNLYTCNADFFSRDVELNLAGQSKLNSAFYVGSPLSVGSSVEITGMIYAPSIDLSFTGSSVVRGFVVGNSIKLAGSAKIIYGEATMDFDRFDKPEQEEPPVVPTKPEVNIYGEGKVISEQVVSRTHTIPEYTLRFSTGPVNYGLWIAGTVEDNCEIYVNGEKAYISSKTNEWSHKIELNHVQRGTNAVTIRIVKDNGDEIVTDYVYDAYFPPIPEDLDNVPGVELTDITAGKPKNGTILIKGTYYDAYDVKPEIYVNGVKASVARMNDEEELPFRNEENEFWATIPIPAGHATVEIAAMNCYGTESQASLDVFYYNDIDPQTAPAPVVTGRAGSANAQHMAYIAGTVSDLNDTTVQVTVNGEPAYINESGAFSVKQPVTDGFNTFTIVATNVYGKQTTLVATRTYALS